MAISRARFCTCSLAAVSVGSAVVHVEFAKAHVLANLGNEVVHILANQALQGFGVGGLVLENCVHDTGSEILEVVTAGHEVGLALQGSHGNPGGVGILGKDHQTFAGGAAGLLGGLGHALLAQVVDGLFHIAAHFHEGLLAIHHASASSFTQVFHHCSSNGH